MIKYLKGNSKFSETKGVFTNDIKHSDSVCVRVIPRDDGCSMSYNFTIANAYGAPYTVSDDIVSGTVAGIDNMNNDICNFDVKLNPVFTANGSHKVDHSALKYIITGLSLINRDFMTFAKHVKQQESKQPVCA